MSLSKVLIGGRATLISARMSRLDRGSTTLTQKTTLIMTAFLLSYFVGEFETGRPIILQNNAATSDQDFRPRRYGSLGCSAYTHSEDGDPLDSTPALHQVLASVMLFNTSYTLHRLIHSERPLRTNTVIVSLVIILLIADIILTIVFIIGCHMKKPGLIKTYYYYNLFLLALITPLCLYDCGYSTYIMIKYPMSFITTAVILLSIITGSLVYLIIQIYVTLLVRSQFMKLNDGCQFRFENKVAEAECSLNIEEMAGEKSADYKTTLDDYDDEIGNFV